MAKNKEATSLDEILHGLDQDFALATLPEANQSVLRMHFGLDQRPLNSGLVATELKLPRDNVDRIVQKSLLRLKNLRAHYNPEQALFAENKGASWTYWTDDPKNSLKFHERKSWAAKHANDVPEDFGNWEGVVNQLPYEDIELLELVNRGFSFSKAGRELGMGGDDAKERYNEIALMFVDDPRKFSKYITKILRLAGEIT